MPDDVWDAYLGLVNRGYNKYKIEIGD